MATAEEVFEIQTFSTAGSTNLVNKARILFLKVLNDIATGQDTNDPPFNQGNMATDTRKRFIAEVVKSQFDVFSPVFAIFLGGQLSLTVNDIINLSDTDIEDGIALTIDNVAEGLEIFSAPPTPGP